MFITKNNCITYLEKAGGHTRRYTHEIEESLTYSFKMTKPSFQHGGNIFNVLIDVTFCPNFNFFRIKIIILMTFFIGSPPRPIMIRLVYVVI